MNLKALMQAAITVEIDPYLDWPRMHDPFRTQQLSNETPPSRFRRTTEGIKDKNSVHWIPSDADLIKLRISIAAHTGMAGHRGYNTTNETITKHFWWSKIDEDVKEFVYSFLHCLATNPGKVIQRPLVNALHASKPNEMLHLDFCFMIPEEY